MDKPHYNVILFDEEEPQHQTKQYYKDTKQEDIIEQEVHFLAEKIKSLDLQIENLQILKNESNSNHRNQLNNTDASQKNSNQIFMIIQKKIQIIVRETKRIVDKLGETFDKKLQNKINRKYEESGISKIKESYNLSVKKIEDFYKKEVERLIKENKESEARMLKKVSEVQQQLLNKMNQFDIKEKQYVDWIHYLQIQLKQKQQKSKKMIEVTQQKSKKDLAENNSTISNHQQYQSVKNNNQNSKVQRKHRIFDNYVKGSSVSPVANKVVSPLGSNTMYSTKIVNPLKPKIDFEEQNPQIQHKLTEKTTNTNTALGQNYSSPWKAIDKSYGQITKRSTKIVKEVNEVQFYKDLPKANQGWERFQDLKDNQNSSDSEDDVYFYQENNKSSNEQPIQKRQGHRNEQFQEKVFSPFDLN